MVNRWFEAAEMEQLAQAALRRLTSRRGGAALSKPQEDWVVEEYYI